MGIQNGSEHYIVIDFSEKPLQVEVQDGWHTIFGSRMWWTPSEAIPEGTDYWLDFKWKDVLGGTLKPGAYRAILYFGDGEKRPWDWYGMEQVFQVD